MKIRKEELPVLLFWKYGKCEGEEERAQEYIRKIKGTELKLSTDNFCKLMEDMLNYVWEEKIKTEEGAEENTEEDTDEVEEETREFGYDFFFN